MVERYRLALAVTHGDSQLERTFQIFNSLVFVSQKAVSGSRMRERRSLCLAVVNARARSQARG